MTASRCPGCRARMASDDSICARCGCDLSLVRRTEAHAARLLAAGLQAWAEGEPDRARSRVGAALALVRSPLARALLRAIPPGQVQAECDPAPQRCRDGEAQPGHHEEAHDELGKGL